MSDWVARSILIATALVLAASFVVQVHAAAERRRPLYRGPLRVTTPNALIEGRRIVGTLLIEAPNVTVSACHQVTRRKHMAVKATGDWHGMTLTDNRIEARSMLGYVWFWLTGR